MMVLITYDVSTTDKAGQTRLRRVAKQCQNHGQRVQNSVFEADLDYGSFLKLKDSLIKIIDEEKDSLRFYYIGNNWERRVEHIGAKQSSCSYQEHSFRNNIAWYKMSDHRHGCRDDSDDHQ